MIPQHPFLNTAVTLTALLLAALFGWFCRQWYAESKPKRRINIYIDAAQNLAAAQTLQCRVNDFLKNNNALPFYIPGYMAIDWHRWLDEYHPEVLKLDMKAPEHREVQIWFSEFLQSQTKSKTA